MSTGSPLYFFSAGEPSGDQHAANLIRELRHRFPNARFVGCGGPAMQEAGCEILVPLTKVAVMGIIPVLLNIRTILHCLRTVKLFLQTEQPDAIILIDFPGFNWRIAKQAKKAGVPVIYFMPPQIWAWAQWRVRKMKKLIDHVLCPLEFEEKWFRSRGINVELIGHPFFESVRKRKLDSCFIANIKQESKGRKILAVLPGSRDQEVKNNIQEQWSTIQKVKADLPDIFPVIAAYKESQGERIRSFLAERGAADIPVYVGRTQELMKAADSCLAVSGSVSLELLANACPTVIYYRITKPAAWAARFFIKVKYITLTNLIAADLKTDESPFYSDSQWPAPSKLSDHDRHLMVFPEYLAAKDCSSEAAQDLVRWLSDDRILAAKRKELNDLLEKVDRIASPVTVAADSIAKFLQGFRSIK